MFQTDKRVLMIAILAIVLLMFLWFFTGCNYQVVDTKYNFDRVMIRLPDGEVIEGKLESWRDYEDSDQLQVKINGVTYLVHANNCVLISTKGENQS